MPSDEIFFCLRPSWYRGKPPSSPPRPGLVGAEWANPDLLPDQYGHRQHSGTSAQPISWSPSIRSFVSHPSPDSGDRCQMANLETVALTHTAARKGRTRAANSAANLLPKGIETMPYLAHSAGRLRQNDWTLTGGDCRRCAACQMLHSDERRLRGLLTERTTIQELDRASGLQYQSCVPSSLRARQQKHGSSTTLRVSET